jgi:hypothetical protein
VAPFGPTRVSDREACSVPSACPERAETSDIEQHQDDEHPGSGQHCSIRREHTKDLPSGRSRVRVAVRAQVNRYSSGLP